MMFELSPEDTDTNASARPIPAFARTSRSNPTPRTVVSSKSGPRRRNAFGSWSMIPIVCPRSTRLRARDEPTRPHPMITTCTGTPPLDRTCSDLTAPPVAAPRSRPARTFPKYAAPGCVIRPEKASR
nr:hypothetical protein GCM10025732_53380 [Glycomyces mayteni]